MNSQRARSLLKMFAGKRVVVIGDVMLDEYIWGQVNRVSPEAPVIVVDAERQTHVPGGAANVVNNLCALGAIGAMVGAVGADPAGEALIAALKAEGADTAGMVTTAGRPTTRKTRIIAHSQQVVRVDHEQRSAMDGTALAAIIESVEAMTRDADAVLISDYQKGVVCAASISAAVEAARSRGCTATGNLKPAAVAGRAALDVITMNLAEATIAMGGMPLAGDLEIAQAGMGIAARTGSRYVLITRGSRGLTLVAASGDVRHIAPRPVEVYDTAGAGDTVISTLTLALACGADPFDAVDLANHAAAEAVKKLGVATVSAEEVARSFED